ncbi:effector-associated domain EAD1-containing protein [Saccharothrix sp.]|uniref:effector-associated domain EAD1-containing protein n=1 Tax=Saccharothrix sp. TaxID=1873460 RepID=UPI002810DD38|nr:effector-associated domain EAD1-containing protein [Saccharothrix sp.]
MGRVTFRQLRREGAFALLGTLFGDRSSCLALLEDAGVPASSVPPPDSLPPEQFWREVCRRIDHGGFPLDLEKLLLAALEWYPANAQLRRLAAGSGPGRALCLLSSPTNAARVRLDVEHRTILEISARLRNLSVVVNPATRVRDIVPALLEAQPELVHFSGHGTADGSLVFEDDAGNAAPVAVDDLARSFAVLDDLRCVLLNSCYTTGYAEALRSRAEAVIGSTIPLGDECATAFTRGFYTALGHGGTLRRGYDAGLAEMGLRGCPVSGMRYLEGTA